MASLNVQRGSMPLGPPLFALALGGIAVFPQLPGERGWVGYAGLAAWLGVLAWLAARTGALPLFDGMNRAAQARFVQERRGGELATEETQVWGGGTATEYRVTWTENGRTFRFDAGVSGIGLGLIDVNPARASVILSCDAKGQRFAQGKETDAPWLEAERAALAQLAAAASPEGVTVGTSAEIVRISASGVGSKAGLTQFLDLAAPLLPRIAAPPPPD